MKILVGVKRVIDYKTVVRLKADGSSVETTNVKMSMNPFDEIAVEEAVRLKEKAAAKEVVVVSIGSSTSQETLRTALAMGADRGILLTCAEALEPLTIAKLLQKIILEENPNLVILGKQAIDSDDNQVGQMLAGILNWPQGTFASKVVVENDKVQVTREVDGGLETLLLKLPAVITTDLRLNEPRYLSLPNIVKAKAKKIDTKDASSFGIELTPHIPILSVAIPQRKRAGVKVENATQLVEALRNHEQVLS